MPSWFKKAPADPAQIIGDEFDQPNSGAQVADDPDLMNKVEVPPAHEQLTEEQAAHKLHVYRNIALHDPNLPTEDIDAIEGALDAHDAEKENHLVEELIEDSPYPEVRPSTNKHTKLHLITFPRCELRFATMMLIYPPAQSVPGQLA